MLRKVTERTPDLIIGAQDNPYMKRWVLKRWKGFQLALHNIMRSDDDRALHDHVGWNISIILTGYYYEWLFDPRADPTKTPVPGSAYPYGYRRRLRLPLVPYFRPAARPHRLEINRPVWTIWLRGPHIREWGFWCKQGWVHWTQFTAGGRNGNSTIGRGCD